MDYSSLYTNITNVTCRMADTAAFVHHLQHFSLNRQQRERKKKKNTRTNRQAHSFRGNFTPNNVVLHSLKFIGQFGNDVLTENRVPQNRETREKMKKSRLKKFSNIFYIINQMIYKGLYSKLTKGIKNN